MMIAPSSMGVMPLSAVKPTECCDTGVPMSDFPDFIVRGSASGGSIFTSSGQTLGSISGSTQTVTCPDGSTETFTVMSVNLLNNLPGQGFNHQVYGSVSAGGCTLYTPLIHIIQCDGDGACISFGVDCDSKSLGPVSFTNIFHLDKVNIINGKAEAVSDPINNGFGQQVPCYSLKRPTFVFDLYLSIGFKLMLECMDQYDWVKIIDKKNGCEFDLDPTSIEVSGSGECLFAGTIGYALKDSWKGRKGCECSAFESTTEPDPCDPEPDECAACQAEVTESGGVLTVNITSPPPGTPVITWTQNGSFIGVGTTVDTGGQPGSYIAKISFDGCPTKSVGYTILDCCAGFSMQAVVAGTKIDTAINGLADDDVVMYEICDSEGTVVSTTVPYTDAEPGSYIVKATTEKGCEAIQSVLVTEDGCAHSIRVDKADGTMTGVIEDCPDGSTPTYVWEQQSEGGGRTQVGTGATYTPSETGMYWFIGICDGCSKESAHFCIVEDEEEECIKVEIKNLDELMIPAPIVNNNVNNVINVDACCDEDEECACTFTITCLDCILNSTTCEGWTIGPWVGDDGINYGSGPGPIPVSMTVAQNYQATATKEGCDPVTLNYFHTPANPGVVNPNPPDVDPV